VSVSYGWATHLNRLHSVGAHRSSPSTAYAALKGKLSRGNILLDVGCGDSYDRQIATSRGVIAYGVDLLPPLKRTSDRFIRADARRLPFANKSVDAVICQAMVSLIPPDDRFCFYTEVFRVLKPYGWFSIVFCRLTDGQLVLQDVLTLHGSQFKNAHCIVCSPPCQEYSYMAMPWTLAKEKRARILADAKEQKRLNALFDACFRIQREASEAAGRRIPLIVENVRGAQEWVGKAAWHFGSFYLWGDIPALMPMRGFGQDNKIPAHINESIRNGRSPARWTNPAEHYFGIKVPGNKLSENGFAIPVAREIDKSQKPTGFQLSQDDKRQHLSYSRKAASAAIAKIPFVLAQHIARAWKP
jgi:SAM-dependent methyltransferase